MDMKIISYDNSFFAKNIDYLTKKKNITRKQIENELGLGAGSLSRYCRSINASKPGIEIIINLAKFLEVKIDDLINTDLEIENEKEIKNKGRKEIITCQKLIDETNNNLHDWTICNLGDGYFEEYEPQSTYNFDDILSCSSDGNLQYSSKFLHVNFDIDIVGAYIVDIGEGTSVLVVEVFLDNKNNKYDHDFNYEVYFTKENNSIYEILPLCSGYNSRDIFSNDFEIDQDIYSKAKKLYKTALYYHSYGKQRYKVEDICDRYLNSSSGNLEIPF